VYLSIIPFGRVDLFFSGGQGVPFLRLEAAPFAHEEAYYGLYSISQQHGSESLISKANGPNIGQMLFPCPHFDFWIFRFPDSDLETVSRLVGELLIYSEKGTQISSK